tara:strand:+ start:4142 stop:4615 length:474 start_codon:yes stop_codon:yes gene_type:complete
MQNMDVKLGEIRVSKPKDVEVPESLIELVGDQLRLYVLEDGLKDAELEVLARYGEAVCSVVTDVRDTIVLGDLDYAQWMHDISPTLISHAKANQKIYNNLSYMRTEVIRAKSWVLLTLVELALVKKQELKSNLEIEYIVRFGENVVGQLFATIEATK